MRARTFVDLAFGLAVSAAVLYGMWTWFGPFGLVYGMPVIAILTIPLLEMWGLIPWLAKWWAYRKYAGRYYEYRGHHLDIEIDGEATCWVSTADLRKIVPTLPSDAVLARMHPSAAEEGGDPRTWRITSQALALVLQKATDAETTRLCHWLETQVAQPARKKLQRRMPLR